VAKQLGNIPEGTKSQYLWNVIRLGEDLVSEACSQNNSARIPAQFLDKYKDILNEAKVVTTNLHNGIQVPGSTEADSEVGVAVNSANPGDAGSAVKTPNTSSAESDGTAQVPKLVSALPDQGPSTAVQGHTVNVVVEEKSQMKTAQAAERRLKAAEDEKASDLKALERKKWEVQQQRDERRRKQQLLLERKAQERKHRQQQLQLQRRQRWKQQEEEDMMIALQRQKELEEAERQRQEQEREQRKTEIFLSMFQDKPTDVPNGRAVEKIELEEDEEDSNQKQELDQDL
jgi:hypothetical protein